MSTVVGNSVGGIVGGAIAIAAMAFYTNRSENNTEGPILWTPRASVGSQLEPNAKAAVAPRVPPDQEHVSHVETVAFSYPPGSSAQDPIVVTNQPGDNRFKAEEDFAQNEIASLFQGPNPDTILKNKDVLFAKIKWEESIRSRALYGLNVARFTPSLAGRVEGLWRELRDGLKSDAGLLTRIAQSVASGGSFEFLGVRNKPYRAISDDRAKERTVALFRLITKNPTGMNCDGLDYFDFVLGRGTSGDEKSKDVFIADLYDYKAGEDLSQTFHRSFLEALWGQLSEDLISRQEDRAYWKNIEKINAMRLAFIGNGLPALESIYSTLPVEVQNDQAVLILTLQAAIKYNDAEKLVAAYGRFSKRDPNLYANPDPAANLIAMDGWVRMGPPQLARALECVKELGSTLALQPNTDPYLDVIRAYIYARADKPQEAGQFAQAALSRSVGIEGRRGGKVALNNALLILLYVSEKEAKSRPTAASTVSPYFTRQAPTSIDRPWLEGASFGALKRLETRMATQNVAPAPPQGEYQYATNRQPN
jgi:hypothetical protein